AAIILKIILNMLLVEPLGINGIALSTVLVTLFNGTVLGILCRRKVQIGYRKLFFITLKILLAAAVAWIFGALVEFAFSYTDHWSLVFGVVKVGVIMVTMLLVYLGVAHLLKLEYLGVIIERIRGKLNVK
ncbi:integral membrane protein, partial [Candidatus Gastranaerophilus sp. (ex Termes propinquus)]